MACLQRIIRLQKPWTLLMSLRQQLNPAQYLGVLGRDGIIAIVD